MAEYGKFPFEMYAAAGEERLVNSTVHEHSTEIIEVLSGSVKIQIGTEVLDRAELPPEEEKPSP